MVNALFAVIYQNITSFNPYTIILIKIRVSLLIVIMFERSQLR